MISETRYGTGTEYTHFIVTSTTETYSSFDWDTTLWVRHNKPYACNRMNYLQGRMRFAKGKSRNKIDLEMLRLSELIREAA